MNACNRLAAWMIEQGFVTGHGDNVEDLLGELKPQIDRLRAEVVTLRNAAVNADERTDRTTALLAAYAAYGASENKERLVEIGRRIDDRELLAQMMIQQSMSTGHGDTVGDLVRELEPQIERMRAEVAEAMKARREKSDETARMIAEERDRLRELLREFCDRVERGAIRSVTTYAKFKAALKKQKK